MCPTSVILLQIRSPESVAPLAPEQLLDLVVERVHRAEHIRMLLLQPVPDLRSDELLERLARVEAIARLHCTHSPEQSARLQARATQREARTAVEGLAVGAGRHVLLDQPSQVRVEVQQLEALEAAACQQRYRWHLEKNATQMPAISWQLTPRRDNPAVLLVATKHNYT